MQPFVTTRKVKYSWPNLEQKIELMLQFNSVLVKVEGLIFIIINPIRLMSQ